MMRLSRASLPIRLATGSQASVWISREIVELILTIGHSR
jgi:hypothetical protein